jgi:hypothetical protein
MMDELDGVVKDCAAGTETDKCMNIIGADQQEAIVRPDQDRAWQEK